tara:strand:- start:199 stop:495 length:297 start_codon:yes stop_codon:yes gene_type:complete
MELLTQAQAAVMLNVSIKTIYRLRKNKRLTTVRPTDSLVRVTYESCLKIRTEKCEKKSRPGSGQKVGTFTFISTTDVASEKLCGRLIYESRPKGSRVG